MSHRPAQRPFRIAFSLAGEQKNLVKPISDALKERLDPSQLATGERSRVFFYPDEDTVGARSDTFRSIYKDERTLLIPCISEEYGNKRWTNFEWRIIRQLLFLPTSDDEPKDDLGVPLRFLRIYPIRVGKGDVPGLPEDAISAVVTSVEKIVDQIVARIELLEHHYRDIPFNDTPMHVDLEHCIYLADCPAEMRIRDAVPSRQQVKEHLEKHCWRVLPDHDFETDKIDATEELKAMLKCSVFIQLLGRDDMNREGTDEFLYETAVKLGLRTLRFCPATEYGENISERDRFIRGADVFRNNFREFLGTITRLLGKIRNNQVFDCAMAQPVVQVAIPTRDKYSIFDMLLEVLESDHDFRLEPRQIDSLKDAIDTELNVEKLHGLVIACNRDSIDTSKNSPAMSDDFLTVVRLIQSRYHQMERHDRFPPIAIAFWPPTEAENPFTILRLRLPQYVYQITVEDSCSFNAFCDRIRVYIQ
ncbi:hypothetical protein GC197_06630 [bacterium]|nr:hypothetical protein [bacterium]